MIMNENDDDGGGCGVEIYSLQMAKVIINDATGHLDLVLVVIRLIRSYF